MVKEKIIISVSSVTSAALNEMETRSFWNKFGL